ncbi:uncharacterized protein TNCV_762331 [Trichonephila clavipes]|nr:uncharacterized protein TNCV_762331 [Trichonephila clavipes]
MADVLKEEENSAKPFSLCFALYSNGDEEILSEFDKSVNFVDGRYRVNLPWKPGMREALQNNKTVAQVQRAISHTFELLNSSIYVDDLICGQNDVPDALRTTLECFKYSVTQAVIAQMAKRESKSAYGTILYLRFVTCNNEIETSFICSKSSPLKSLTLPRLLELTILSAKLAKQVSSLSLKFDANIYYWTSLVLLERGDSSAFKPYIKNRVQEIQLLSDPMQWGHCPKGH